MLKFSIDNLQKIILAVKNCIQSTFYYVLLTFKKCIRESVIFAIKHKQLCIKLAIPFIIICIAYYACSATQRMIKQNISEIFVISDEIRTHYADKPDYWGLSSDKVVEQNLIPNKFVKNKKITLSSGTIIAVGNGINADAVMPFSQTFDIILSNVNKAQCISYAEAPLSEDNLIKLYSLHIINKSGEFIFEWGGEKKLPVSRYTTKDLCLDNGNTIIWSIK